MSELETLLDNLIEAAWASGPHGHDTEQGKIKILEYVDNLEVNDESE